MAKEIPGPKGWPLVGNFGQFDTGKLHTSMYNLQKDFGGLSKVTLFGQTIVVISEIDLMENAFNEKTICYRPNNYIKWLKYDGAGYLDSNFSEKDLKLKTVVWNAIKRAKYDSTVAEYAKQDLEVFLDSLGETTDNVQVVESLMRAGAKQLASTITGVKGTDEQVGDIIAFLDAMNNLILGGKTVLLAAMPWLRYVPSSFKWAVDAIMTSREKVTETLIGDSKKGYERGKEHGILHHLFTAQEDVKNEMSDVTVKACVLDLLFNGVIPIGQNIAYIMLQAITHPELQQKIHDELKAKGVDKTKAIADIKIEDLPFTESFILESMRYSSLVNISVPHTVNEDTVVDGYLFPKGSVVFGNTFGIHHDEKNFDKPWDFDPGRFLDKSGNILPVTDPIRKSLVHFGVGMRKCRGPDIAMGKITSTVLGIFSRYKVLRPTDADLPTTDPREYRSIAVIDLPFFSCRFEKK